MCVCVCVCVRIYIYIYIYVNIRQTWSVMSKHWHVRGDYWYVCKCVYTQLHIYMHIYIHIYMYTYIYTHTHVYIYIYIYTYISIRRTWRVMSNTVGTSLVGYWYVHLSILMMALPLDLTPSSSPGSGKVNDRFSSESS